MPGVFLQSAVVLFDRAPTLDDLAAALTGFAVVGRVPPSEGQRWAGGVNGGLLVDHRPEVNGRAVVEVVGECWPDHLGDPDDEPDLFNAWGMGFFGQSAWPGCLSRAVDHCMVMKGAAEVVASHRAFVRVLFNYAIGAADSDPAWPAGRNEAGELRFVTELARAIGRLRGAVAFFNPNGEVVVTPDMVEQAFELGSDDGGDHAAPPMDTFSNIRLYVAEPGWAVFDCVGMDQAGLVDHEVCFPVEGTDPAEVAAFVRNISWYMLSGGPKISSGEIIEDTGGTRWQAYWNKEALLARPRPTLRWFPADVDNPDLVRPESLTPVEPDHSHDRCGDVPGCDGAGGCGGVGENCDHSGAGADHDHDHEHEHDYGHAHDAAPGGDGSRQEPQPVPAGEPSIPAWEPR